jgi:MraZ protein
MLLTGTFERTLDQKKRLALSKKIREQLGDPDSLFITPGPDQCLWLYSQPGFERFSGKLEERPETDVEARVFRRLYYGQTEKVEVDRAGRILIPDRLIQFAGLQHAVVLIGIRDHLEIWDASRWQQYLAQHSPRFDAVAENTFRK